MNDRNITARSVRNETILTGNDNNPHFKVLRDLSRYAELGNIAVI
jgi:hypothetical protein